MPPSQLLPFLDSGDMDKHVLPTKLPISIRLLSSLPFIISQQIQGIQPSIPFSLFTVNTKSYLGVFGSIGVWVVYRFTSTFRAFVNCLPDVSALCIGSASELAHSGLRFIKE